MKAFAPPLFESSLLHEIATAIELRSKAIRYHGHLACSRETEESRERLNVDFSDSFRRHVRLSIWTDGQLWLCVTQPGPNRTGGWALNHELRSHIAEFDGEEVCRRFEQTIHEPAEARTFWPTFSHDNRNA